LRSTNAQSELHPLEIGLHALRSGLSVRDYADRVGLHERTLLHRVEAARVVAHVGDWHTLVSTGERGSLTKEWHIGPCAWMERCTVIRKSAC
jgi:hypothetical protein